MIQTQPMLEECGGTDGGCGGSGGGMVGAAPLHHHPNHHHHHQPNHHHHHPHHPQVSHHHTPGGVYMKPVYNLSSLCHQGPLTPPDRMASPTSQTSSSVSPSSGPLHHLPVYHHGTGGADTGSGASTNGHTGHFRPAQLSVPVFPAKRLRGGDHHHPHPPLPHPHHPEMLRCKRRVDLSLKLGYKTHPTAVARRNERERNRVKHINSTFSTLRQHIPCAAKNKKMSKVETLRSAIRYINHLQQILETQKAQEEAEMDEAERGEGEGEHEGGMDHQRHPPHHQHHIRHIQHHPTIHLFSPGGSSSIGSPGANTTPATTRLDCDVTAVRMRSSSVLLSPPGSPTSCDGRPGSADSHDLSPRRHYDYVTALHDEDDVGDDVDNDVDEDDDDPHDLSQFGDWF